MLGLCLHTPNERSEVKATLKKWSPGIVEACSRANFVAAMGGLRDGDRLTFERVCEVAAAVLSFGDEVRQGSQLADYKSPTTY